MRNNSGLDARQVTTKDIVLFCVCLTICVSDCLQYVLFFISPFIPLSHFWRVVAELPEGLFLICLLPVWETQKRFRIKEYDVYRCTNCLNEPVVKSGDDPPITSCILQMEHNWTKLTK